MAEPAPDPHHLDDAAVETRLSRLDDILRQLEQIPGHTADLAMEAVETLTEVYGEALRRVVAHAAESPQVLASFTRDELVSHLLLLHAVHPDPLEVRVARAVDDLLPHLRSQGAAARLTDMRDGVVQLTVSSGSCGSCGSTAELHDLVREHVLTMAPELSRVDVTAPAPAPTLIPMAALSRRPWPVEVGEGPG
jgi:Fe-S cluster biogenesis protein NfuA